MTKRRVLILTLLCLCALPAFSLSSGGIKKNTLVPDFSISAGGRIFYNGMFDIAEWSWYGYSYNTPRAAIMIENSMHLNHGFGIGAFFDATYLEVGMDFIFGSFEQYAGAFAVTSTQFGFTILGKFPVAAGPVTVFPLAGIDYQIFLSGEAEGLTIKRDDMSDYYPDMEDLYDAFSLVVGAGLDYNISAKLYLRGEVLCNFKMESESDKALKKLAREDDVSFSLFTFGPRVSIGVGYKF
jgi:hypothetical protein